MEKSVKEKFRQRLESRASELLTLIEQESESVKPVELDQTRVGRVSRSDALQGQAMSVEVGRRRQVELQKVRAALARIDDDFGECIDCGNEIDERRLELDPSATLCISCANARENNC